MTTQVCMASNPGTFDTFDECGVEDEGMLVNYEGRLQPTLRTEPLALFYVSAGRPVSIGRRKSGLGWLINMGPKTLQLEYWARVGPPGERHEWKGVGPLYDFILPGHCKEIGIGPSVRWMVKES